MLARLQRFTTALLLAIAGLWLAFWWQHSVPLALSGFVFLLLGYSLFLAAEFVALHSLNRRDPIGPATWGETLRAWWGETLTGPRVFCWRQPFRANAVPDYLPHNGQRGAVLVHGFICNRGLWTPWLKQLRQRERAFVAVNLEPVFGSIDEYVAIIEQAVARVTAATGQAPLVVCHSMGGLALRAWLRAGDNEARVHHVVTIGTPHGGTWLGRFSQVTNGSQMRLGSSWLTQLRSAESPQRYARFTCWYTNCDNIVFPTSTGSLPGADNRLMRGVAHVSLAFDARVMQSSLALLGAPQPRAQVAAASALS